MQIYWNTLQHRFSDTESNVADNVHVTNDEQYLNVKKQVPKFLDYFQTHSRKIKKKFPLD